jgi:RHS repeat-associated protein
VQVETRKRPSRRSARRRDAHNRRLRKIVAEGGVENSPDVPNGTTDYAYQGWRVLWEEFVPEVMPFAPATGPVTFVYGNYLDEVWNAMETDGAEVYSHYYFLTGVNYSVMGVIDAYTGGNTLAEAYEYDPYGRHRVIDPGTDTTYFTSDDTYDELAPGAIDNSIRYTGQRFDAESGLMYYKNRYYDPAAGRFIGRDPLGWRAGANRYGYVGGMPTMAVDPEGLLVTAILDTSAGTLTVTDDDTGEQVVLRAFSGGQANFECEVRITDPERQRPLPKGDWFITDHPYTGTLAIPYDQDDWLGVLRDDDVLDDIWHEEAPGYFWGKRKEKRDGARLHLGSLSEGCVTVCESDNEKWEQLKNMLRRTKTEELDYVDQHKGVFREQKTKKLTHYGNLEVK